MGKQVGPVLETLYTAWVLETTVVNIQVLVVVEIMVTRKMLIVQMVRDIEVIEIIIHTVIEMVVIPDIEEKPEMEDTKVVIVTEKWSGMRILNQNCQDILSQ